MTNKAPIRLFLIPRLRQIAILSRHVPIFLPHLS
jgi:hypothetical protein